jgi:hypothetical protein
LTEWVEAAQPLDALSMPRPLDLGLLFGVLATALDEMFSLAGQLAAGFRFVGHGSGTAFPDRLAEESLGSHEPDAHVEDHSLEAPKAFVLALGRQDHVLAFLQWRRRRG